MKKLDLNLSETLSLTGPIRCMLTTCDLTPEQVQFLLNFRQDKELRYALWFNGHHKSGQLITTQEIFKNIVNAPHADIDAIIERANDVLTEECQWIGYTMAALLTRRDLTEDHIRKIFKRIPLWTEALQYIQYHPSCTPELALELTLKHG